MPRFAVAALASVLVAQAGDLRILDAVRAENKAQLRTLLAQKADVNAVAEDGTAALHWAVDYDDLEVVDLLLKAGAKPDIADRYGMAPLFYAVTAGNPAMVSRLDRKSVV